MIRRNFLSRRSLQAAVVALLVLLPPAAAAQREPNSAYAERRARLRSQLDGPVVLFGYTGREDSSPSYVFHQEENFYYLTGHNEPGAALLLIPNLPERAQFSGPREILFLPPRDARHERWEGPRLAPGDTGLAEKTGMEGIEPIANLRDYLERLARIFPNFYTLLPSATDAGYPHARNWFNWLHQQLPETNWLNSAGPIAALRQVKSKTELALLERAIELSMDAHLEAMKMMRPGLYEYELAARMEYVHKRGGCEREAYAPIVGTGFNSTVLHYSPLRAQIHNGEIVVLDVACQYAGYSADITRTLPANGQFTPRQREIYEIVLGAQNAVLAALKPGTTLARSGPNSLYRIAYDYINSHGKDKDGQALGRYFIHGLGHHIGLNVHDPGDTPRPLEPGMIVTIEPGIYLPEENLGVRIEDIVLITETGYTLMTARLPRGVAEIEKIMAEARTKP